MKKAEKMSHLLVESSGLVVEITSVTVVSLVTVVTIVVLSGTTGVVVPPSSGEGLQLDISPDKAKISRANVAWIFIIFKLNCQILKHLCVLLFWSFMIRHVLGILE